MIQGRIRPLSLEIEPGNYRRVRTFEDAAEILLAHPEWPDGGSKRQAALRAFIAALDGTGSAGTARDCFLEAVAEAGIFVRDV